MVREAIFLIYVGKLPPMNALYPNPWRRKALKDRALKQFGIMPTLATQMAHVTITRVLGKRERLMDDDNFAFATKGARDALRNSWVSKSGKWHPGGNYIVDDSPTWARFKYLQDDTRRHEGPRIEISIEYL